MGATGGLFLSTFIIGLVVAAPVGAMAILCIQRVLAHGLRAGVATGAGIATADALFAAVAAFGVTAVANWLVTFQAEFRIIGGTALIWFGLRAMRTKPSTSDTVEVDTTRLAKQYSTAVGLTLTNPMTIMAFAAVFASAGLATQASVTGAVVVTLGVASGSLIWWLALSTGVWTLRHMVSDKAVIIVNRVSGGVLAAWGVAAIVAGVRAFG